MSRLTVESAGTSKSYSDTRGHIVDLGTFGEDQTVTLTFELDSAYTSAEVTVYMFSVNEQALTQFYEAISQSPLEVDSYSDTEIKAHISADNDGILYTSIPYDKGWHVQVDGTETEIQSMADGLLYIPMSAGEHTVTMTYRPQGFIPGMAISACSLFIFTVIYFRNRAREIKNTKKRSFS